MHTVEVRVRYGTLRSVKFFSHVQACARSDIYAIGVRYGNDNGGMSIPNCCARQANPNRGGSLVRLEAEISLETDSLFIITSRNEKDSYYVQ